MKTQFGEQLWLTKLELTDADDCQRAIRAALPFLRVQGGGRILQVSSAGGQVAFPNFSAYHATKWGIEGFIESVAQEVGPFHIEFTIVEPGATKTGFSSSLVAGQPLQIYDNTPAGEVRRLISTGGFPKPGDAARIAQAMIDSVDRHAAPKRLPLGSDTFTGVRAALMERLAALETQKEIALAADADARSADR